MPLFLLFSQKLLKKLSVDFIAVVLVGIFQVLIPWKSLQSHSNETAPQSDNPGPILPVLRIHKLTIHSPNDNIPLCLASYAVKHGVVGGVSIPPTHSPKQQQQQEEERKRPIPSLGNSFLN